MVYADTVLEAIKGAVADAGRLPAGSLPHRTAFVTKELDPQGEHADIPLPVIEFAPTDIQRDTSRNKDLVGYETDTNGNQIGEIWRYFFRMSIEVNPTVAAQSGDDPRQLARYIREALSPYDTRSGDTNLPHPDGDGTLTMADLVVGDREPNNEFSTSPSLRTSQVSLEARFSHELKQSDIVGEQTPVGAVTLDIDVRDASGTAHDAINDTLQ